jgi:Cu/Ag efflux protein CusF
MSRYTLSRYGSVVVAGAALCALAAAAPAQVQGQQMAPPPSGAPPSVRSAEQTRMGTLEGAVKNVDPGAGTVQVSAGPFGMFRKTLEVTADTFIQVEGRQATLADIREGERVNASYETHETKNVATRIEVIPAQPKSKSGASR